MLQRLKTADGLAELSARAQMLRRQLKEAFHRTDAFGAERRDPLIYALLQQLEARIR